MFDGNYFLKKKLEKSENPIFLKPLKNFFF